MVGIFTESSPSAGFLEPRTSTPKHTRTLKGPPKPHRAEEVLRFLLLLVVKDRRWLLQENTTVYYIQLHHTRLDGSGIGQVFLQGHLFVACMGTRSRGSQRLIRA